MTQEKGLSPHWLQAGQFMRNCEDEIYKSVRYQVPFAVVTARLMFINNGCDEVMEHFVETGLRQIDFAGRVSADRYALGLPFTGSKGAEVVAARLRLLLIEFNPIVGTAIAPDDGATSPLLLHAADRIAHEKLAEARTRRIA
jgi:hypothetical protein